MKGYVGPIDVTLCRLYVVIIKRRKKVKIGLLKEEIYWR